MFRLRFVLSATTFSSYNPDNSDESSSKKTGKTLVKYKVHQS